MSLKEKISSFFSRSREKHKLTFINDSTYHEKWGFRLSMMNLYSLLALYTIVIIVLVFVLIRFTPVSNFFNAGTSSSSWEQVEENSQSLDSLYHKMDSNEKYLSTLMTILKDEEFEDSLYMNYDSISDNYVPNFEQSPEDSILRYKMENDDPQDNSGPENNLGFFFPPVKGMVSKSFNLLESHYGVDVVTKKEEAIKACLDGTIIFSGWSNSDGFIIVVQHTNDLVSVYKHCSVLLKTQGNKVQNGDPIAIVGNSGENSSGPHLHFELWKGGNPINPQDYISF